MSTASDGGRRDSAASGARRLMCQAATALAYPRRSAIGGVAVEVEPLPCQARLDPGSDVVRAHRCPGRRPLDLVASDPSPQRDQGDADGRTPGIVGGEEAVIDRLNGDLIERALANDGLGVRGERGREHLVEMAREIGGHLARW